MREKIINFLNSAISDDLYLIENKEININEVEEILKEMEEKYFTKALINNEFTLAEYNHHKAGEILGKAIIIAYEFKGMLGVIQFLKSILERSFKNIINSEANNNKLVKENNNKNLKEILEKIKEEIKNIEIMLKTFEKN